MLWIMVHLKMITQGESGMKYGKYKAEYPRTLVPIVDFTAKNSQSLVILILLITIMNYHVFLHLIDIYMNLKGYR